MPIDVESVVSRMDRRDGFKVISYKEVGLPIYRVTALLTLQSDAGVGAIEEFILRAVSAGVSTIPELMGLLGLSSRIISAQLAQLMIDGCVWQSEESPPGYSLTQPGKERMRSREHIEFRKEPIPLYVDGLTRRISQPDISQLWDSEQLGDLSMAAVRPWPRRVPRIAEIDVADINRMFSQVEGPEAKKKRAVRVEAILGRPSLLFRRAVAVAFKSANGRSIELGFAIDGRESLDHEIAFARRPDKQSSILFGSLFDSDKRRKEAQAVARELRTDVPSLPASNVDGSMVAVATKQRPAKGRPNSLSPLVRTLSVYDHPPLLRGAFEKAKSRLLIVSPWIRASVVNADFISLLTSALDRGVEVTIGYGIAKKDKDARKDDDNARQSLEALAKSFPNFRLVNKGNTHAKILLVDDSYFVTTSFNWLSFRGDPSQPMREEEGTMVSDPALVNAYYQRQLATMDSTD